MSVVYLFTFLAIMAGMWKVFAKADRPGWAALVPIYNLIVVAQIAGKSPWLVLLFLVPCVGIVAHVYLWLHLARAFGKGPGYGLGLAFLSPIFLPILGFGGSKYEGPPTEA